MLVSSLALGIFIAAAMLLALAGIGSRLGWWHFRSGFTLLKFGTYGAIGAVLTGVAGGIMASRARQGMGMALAIIAIAGGLAVAAIPMSWRMKANKVPAIHDITTDTVNPPPFVAILPLRQEAPNPAAYGGTAVADQQKQAYADIRTEVLDLPLGRAFERALAVAKADGWHIVAADPAAGRIEATDTTFWFGFTDDIVIRLVAAGERTLLDIRSVSRVGRSDAGKNADRIRSYLKRLRSYQ